MLKKAVKKAIGLIKTREMIPIMVPTDWDKVLAGKTALVTGGGSGIGLAIAQALSDSGCQVIIAGTNEDKLRTACENAGGGYSAMPCGMCGTSRTSLWEFGRRPSCLAQIG